MSGTGIDVAPNVPKCPVYTGCYGVSFVLAIEQQYPDLDTILQRIYRRIVSLSCKHTVFKYAVRIEDRSFVITGHASYASER